ncbi:hypothetical protein BDW74DRAFT_177705 [Aspergillus multicolor]|uniref:uncharacterized protein n=1 Tax=Aspergillus multicolor TaxID=41759 RepID=UPI003CCDC6DF
MKLALGTAALFAALFAALSILGVLAQDDITVTGEITLVIANSPEERYQVYTTTSEPAECLNRPAGPTNVTDVNIDSNASSSGPDFSCLFWSYVFPPLFIRYSWVPFKTAVQAGPGVYSPGLKDCTGDSWHLSPGPHHFTRPFAVGSWECNVVSGSSTIE